MKVINKTNRPETYQCFVIAPWGDQYSNIEIVRQKKFGSDHFYPTEINFPSFSQRPDRSARDFAAALNTAVLIAGELDKDGYASLRNRHGGVPLPFDWKHVTLFSYTEALPDGAWLQAGSRREWFTNTVIIEHLGAEWLARQRRSQGWLTGTWIKVREIWDEPHTDESGPSRPRVIGTCLAGADSATITMHFTPKEEKQYNEGMPRMAEMG